MTNGKVPCRTCTRKRVRDRLALAEQGHWDILVQQLAQTYRSRAARSPGPLTSPSFQKLCELACAKAAGRCFRAAARLLTVTNCPPISSQTFDLTKALFLTSPLTFLENQQWQASLKRINALPASTLPTITQKAVAHRLLRIRAGAQPGCSRSRNSHLSLVLQAPWGIIAMHGWVQKWAHGKVPPLVSAIWTSGHVKALGKSSPGVRPITLFEAPLKLATGVVLDSQKARTVKALVPHQFGAMLSCGAEQMVHLLRTLSSLYPPNSMVFASTDVKNAFGNASRALVVDSICLQMPAFAHILRPLWGHKNSTLYMPAGQQLFDSFDGNVPGRVSILRLVLLSPAFGHHIL